MIFEDELHADGLDLFTVGPCRVERVEQRREPVVLEHKFTLERMSGPMRSFGVVIFRCKERAAPVVEREGAWVQNPSAVLTRIIVVRATRSGGCDEPEEAGRLLGHYQQDGVRYWAFAHRDEARKTPESAERPSRAAQSPAASRASGASGGSPARPSAPQARPVGASPGRIEGRS